MLNWLSAKTARRDESESRTVNESGSISGAVEANFDVESPSQSVSHTSTDGVDIKITNMGAESVGESAASTSKQTEVKGNVQRLLLINVFKELEARGERKFHAMSVSSIQTWLNYIRKVTKCPQSAQRLAVKSGLNILKII